MTSSCLVFLFFFDDVTASTDVSTLSLHDALPISQAFESAFFRDFDEIDFRAVLAHCIDFDLRRARRHHHRATVSEQRAGVGDRLPEVAGRRSHDVRLLYVRRYVVGRAELEAAGVLKGLTCQNEVYAEVFRETRCIDNCRRPRRPRCLRRHCRPRGLRGLKNLRISAMKRNRTPAQRIALSSVLIPQASRMAAIDRKSTRLNSSHLGISYA